MSSNSDDDFPAFEPEPCIALEFIGYTTVAPFTLAHRKGLIPVRGVFKPAYNTAPRMHVSPVGRHVTPARAPSIPHISMLYRRGLPLVSPPCWRYHLRVGNSSHIRLQRGFL